MNFKLSADMTPAGDQPKAIASLSAGLKKAMRHQTLLGVTGSGKTFTMANVIAKHNKPTLVIAHNKTLAAQLVQEYRTFFPENAVHYFVSYYDFYQPEAYIPVTDTYIEKEAQVNEEIDRLRHAATQALLTRRDVIVVATVSCIYGLGSPVEYEKVNLKVEQGQAIDRTQLIRRLVAIHYERTNADLSPGTLRAIGNAVEVMPPDERVIYRFEFDSSIIASITKVDAISRTILSTPKVIFLFPAKHFIADPKAVSTAMKTISAELEERLKELEDKGKMLEAERLRRRTKYDLALIREIGYCNGIENYSRHFSGKAPGEAPECLLSYFPRTAQGDADFLTVIDESHVTVPQIGGMYAGDASRKQNLIEHGFRLPSARDNRPLKFDEFEDRIGQVIYTSATPGKYEYQHSEQIIEQVIRPTGLIDPEVIVRPVTGSRGQVYDFIDETEKTIKHGGRVLVTTLTKKMSEDLSDYLKERKIKSAYLHSDVATIERIQILTDFRKGQYDCLVGVNLLREGLDMPEVELIGILDADKEGFLRSETALIQTIGRAARNIFGRVILYADVMTGSLERAIGETNRRRTLQKKYNETHGITPKTIIKKIKDITEELEQGHQKTLKTIMSVESVLFEKNPQAFLEQKQSQMNEAVKELDFETAAILRDEIRELYKKMPVKKARLGDKKKAKGYKDIPE